MKFLFILIGAMLAGGAFAAGSGDHSHGEAANIGEPAAAENAGRTVEIILRDNYYEPEFVHVRAGEIVRFAVKNEGRLVHEFNIGTAAMHAAHKDEMLMMVQHGVLFPDRIDREKMAAGGDDGHSMKHDDPNSILLEPGMAGELAWKFSETGKLEFACNIPGHYESGMVGEFKWQ
ncbi:MAG: cupredoxin domain-containing protein [Gammaproteobacteria bacterium]